MKSPKEIALTILKRDTSFGSYSHRYPTDDEFAEYFAYLIVDYGKECVKNEKNKQNG